MGSPLGSGRFNGSCGEGRNRTCCSEEGKNGFHGVLGSRPHVLVTIAVRSGEPIVIPCVLRSRLAGRICCLYLLEESSGGCVSGAGID